MILLKAYAAATSRPWRSYPLPVRNDQFKANIAQNLLKHVWPLLNTAQITPIIDSTYKLKDANLAHQRMETSQHIGKIIIEV